MIRHVRSKDVVIEEVRILPGNRITIPAAVRRALGLKPGDKLRVTPGRYAVILERAKRRPLSAKSRK